MSIHWTGGMAMLLLALAAGTCAQADPAQPSLTWIEAGASASHLTTGSAWRGSYITVVSQRPPRSAWYVLAGADHRFGGTGTRYLAGAYLPVSRDTTLNVEFSASPEHTFLPVTDMSASLDHRLATGWGYALGAGVRTYTAVSVRTGSLSIDRYWKTFHAAYALRGSQLSNVPGTSFSHTLSFAHYYGTDARSSVAASISAGREAENIGGPVLVSAVSAASIGGVHWFAGQTSAITWSLALANQGHLYTRSEIGIGFRHRL